MDIIRCHVFLIQIRLSRKNVMKTIPNFESIFCAISESDWFNQPKKVNELNN